MLTSFWARLRSPRRGACAVRLGVELLEGRTLPAANILVTAARIVDSSDRPLTVIRPGDAVYVHVDYTTQNLPSRVPYRAAFTVNGVTKYTDFLTSGAGTGGGSWTCLWGTWTAAAGTNQAVVTINPDASVAESTYADNSKYFSFTTGATSNITVTGARLVDANDRPLAAVRAGDPVYVHADFTTRDLPGDAAYRVAYTVNGVTRTSDAFNSGAGFAAGSWTFYWGRWTAAPGANQVTVVVNPDSSVAESTYADNTRTFGFVTAAPPSNGFSITLRMPGFTASQQAVFQRAADRWAQVITGDLPNATYQGIAVDDILIDARLAAYDGVDGYYAISSPDLTALRPGSLLPYHGTIDVDPADVASLEANGWLYTVALHEMGHVLGVGTLWQRRGLLSGAGTPTSLFVGPQATAAFNATFGTRATGVPVEASGGPLTRDAHWNVAVFSNELMTGSVRTATKRLSRVTVASLADLGYVVNLIAADPYPRYPSVVVG